MRSLCLYSCPLNRHRSLDKSIPTPESIRMQTAAAPSVVPSGSKATAAAAEPQLPSAITPSSKSSPLRLLTSGTPTNLNMLLFRTFNREMGEPNANEDSLAPLLRDRLMPLRMWWLKHMPGALKAFKRGLEHRKHGVPGVLNFVDARTSWFDSIVKEALGKHSIKQVVVVAAGFDTRAYRIGAQFSGVTFFEVDLPHASQKKQQLVADLLQPEASFPRPTFLAADLASTSLDTVLLAPAPTSSSDDSSGSRFDPAQPTLFTVEGLIYYLPETAVRGLFEAMLRVAAPGSRVAFDFLHKEVLEGSVPAPPAYRVTAISVANKGEAFVSGIINSREAVQDFLDSIHTPAAATNNMTTTTSPSPDAAAAEEAGSGTASVDPSVSAGGQASWRVTDFMGPREAAARQLPHLAWDDAVPPILSFYSFASAEVVVGARGSA